MPYSASNHEQLQPCKLEESKVTVLSVHKTTYKPPQSLFSVEVPYGMSDEGCFKPAHFKYGKVNSFMNKNSGVCSIKYFAGITFCVIS